MPNQFENQLILLVVGFILTTIVGGLLGAYFQNRNWKHQNQIKRAESEREIAKTIFESLSSLMDKRVYRMMQLNWKLRNDSVDEELLKKTMTDYREVLYEWNDNLNRNLALTQSYFGTEVRKRLEGTIYEKFSSIGSNLENGYLERMKHGNADKFKKTNSGLTNLRNDIYKLNLQMIGLIQTNNVGIFNPDNKERSTHSIKSGQKPSLPK